MIYYGNFSLSTTVVFLLSGWIISLIRYLKLAMTHGTCFKKKKKMHFIHLNINSILPKIDELRYISKLTNAIVIGLSETKLDNTVLSGELEIKGYDLVRSDQSRTVGGIVCFVKNSVSYNRKPKFYINTESIL